MAYTPPAPDTIVFDLEVYTPPASDAIAFELAGAGTIYWAVYPSAQANPTDDELITATVDNGIHSNDPAPFESGVFDGATITGLTSAASYRLAAVWSDGVTTSNVVVTAPFVAEADDGGIEGAAELQLAGFTLDAEGTLSVSGASTITLDNLTASATGGVVVSAIAALSLDDIDAASGVSVAVEATAGLALDDVDAASEAAVSVEASASLALGDASVSATIESIEGAVAELGIDDVTLSSSAAVNVSAVGELLVGDATITAAGSVLVSAEAELPLDGAELSALTLALINASGELPLGDASIEATVFGASIEANATLVLDGLGIVSSIGEIVPVTGGGGSKSHKRPPGWSPEPYQRKGVSKLQESARKNRLIAAAKAEDEFIFDAITKLLKGAA
jgi:hypothetical protein